MYSQCFQCFKFHLYIGIRQGGGIGDTLESPAGDPMEYFRIIFDISFFFFIIVILLAIIQGKLALALALATQVMQPGFKIGDALM